MKIFYALDLDRTLVDTDKLYDVLDGVLGQYTSIDLNLLREERMAIEMYGESFDTIGRIQQLLVDTQSSVSWQQIRESFIIEAHRADMLEPYATELLRILDDRRIPHGIVTFGHEAWQLTKMEAARLMEVPRLVTQIKEKGQLLTEWRRADGLFIIPQVMTPGLAPLVADSIVFLDDKAISFKSIPPDVRGVFVRSPTHELLPSQKGVLPTSVTTVTGLNGAIDLLFK